MCGRFTLTNPDPRRLAMRYSIGGDLELDERPRFNIAPTDPVLAVRGRADGDRDLGRLRWGLVPGAWAESGRPLINARSETVASQPAFAELFRERRCLIPADGFYEWRHDPDGKQPIWISRPERELFSFAGIWTEHRARQGEALASCAILTCDPNELMAEIHDRMPVILPPEVESEWLAPDADVERLRELMAPLPADRLETREVSDSVNDARADGPELLEPPMKLF